MLPILLKNIFLIILIWSCTYPLCFWFPLFSREPQLGEKLTPQKSNSHLNKFHIKLANNLAGIIVIIIILAEFPFFTKIIAIFWKLLLLLISAYYWKKSSTNALMMTIPVLLGFITFTKIQAYLKPQINILETTAIIMIGFSLTLFVYKIRIHKTISS